MVHYYRFLSPAEKEFYGLRKTASYITTRDIYYQIGRKKVTVPKGFILDGLDFVDHDFCVQPAWILYEWLYCTHRTNSGVIDRGDTDLYMLRTYGQDLTIIDEELYFEGKRISGADIWQKRLEDGYTLAPELVSANHNIYFKAPEYSGIETIKSPLIAMVTVFLSIGCLSAICFTVVGMLA